MMAFFDNSPKAITLMRARLVALQVYVEEVLDERPGHEKVTVRSALVVVNTLLGSGAPRDLVRDACRAIDAHDGDRLLGEVIRVVKAAEEESR